MSGPSGNVNGTGDFDFKSFFLDIPPITRSVFMVMFTGTLISGLGIFPIQLFVLEWMAVLQKFQIWRIVLTFCHLGRLGLAFLIRMYFLYTYSQQLERGVFFNRPANYAWFLTFVACFVLAMSTIFTSYFNGGAFLIAIIHLWGRHAENVTVSMYGFIKIPAKYLSLTMLGLDVIINGGFSTSEALGLVGGHLYYFLDSVYPTMPDGKQLIFVPVWFEQGITQFQDWLASTTGLHRGQPAASQSRHMQQGGNSVNQSGALNRGVRSSGMRQGLTMPSVRSGAHRWGSGHTLGS